MTGHCQCNICSVLCKTICTVMLFMNRVIKRRLMVHLGFISWKHFVIENTFRVWAAPHTNEELPFKDIVSFRGSRWQTVAASLAAAVFPSVRWVCRVLTFCRLTAFWSVIRDWMFWSGTLISALVCCGGGVRAPTTMPCEVPGAASLLREASGFLSWWPFVRTFAPVRHVRLGFSRCY